MTDKLLYPLLLVGDLIFILTIFLLVKNGKLSVRMSLAWFGLGGVLLIFSAFPVVAKMLRAFLHFEVVANMVFTLLFCFSLLILLLLCADIGQASDKIKRLAQQNAILERRVRQLEDQLKSQNSSDSE